MGSLDRLREILRSGATGGPGAADAARAPSGNSRTSRWAKTASPSPRCGRGSTCPAPAASRRRSAPPASSSATYDADRWHGRARVDESRLLDLDALATLRGRPFDVDLTPQATADVRRPRDDGTARRGGDRGVLVGLGFFDAEGAFRTRQFFLPGFAGERAMLHAVAEAMAGRPLVVTYNGGSFDLPIMETRWLFHRLVPALENRPHLDMLPPARRLWKEQVGGGERSCRLVSLEQSLLGSVRVGDVPGFEIPARYFEFVRTGDAAPLEPVLEHNRFDLLSLAVLMARAQRLVAGRAARRRRRARVPGAGARVRQGGPG